MSIKKTILISLALGCGFISCKQKNKTVFSNQKILTTDNENSTSLEDVKNLPYFNTSDFTPTWTSNNDKVKKFHKISAFKFINQLGEEITNNTFKGSIYIANFFFTSCPSICIKLTSNMHQLQEMYSNDNEIKLLSHSVYPSFDTVDVLNEYAKRHNIDSKKWHLVTGEKEKIYKMAREAYFADDVFKTTNDESRFIHTENLILVDKKGHIRGVYKGTSPKEILRIQRHIEILKKEN